MTSYRRIYRGEAAGENAPNVDTQHGTSSPSGVSTFGEVRPFDVHRIRLVYHHGVHYRLRVCQSRQPSRSGKSRQTCSLRLTAGLRIVECGDIPVTRNQSNFGVEALLQREAFSPLGNDSVTGETLVPLSLDGKNHLRIIILGGDHTIVLPLLRSINSVYGKIFVIHFDSHLDTWKPSVFGGAPSDQAAINHGTYFSWASQEGLIKNGSSDHGAIRTTLSGPEDYDNDDESGFQRIEAREIDTIGTDGIIKKICDTVGDNPVYLSIDIDSIDPAFAPATGTPETGGWSTRELRTILRGLEGMHIVSADIVEVAPAYDANAELTTMAAADVLFEVLSVMAKTPLSKIRAANSA
ncbi:arginase family-domain-containing protein [Favolaschia claudopus]|uniref:Arginase family-domain-containing protein n=1 Tax=Favolaschia claudopus TaxID=2862362 RepID=A0AAW0AGI2_9AGAR